MTDAIERLLAGALAPEERAHVRERVRASDELRRRYDEDTVALRVLEGREIASSEIDLVEARLFDEAAWTEAIDRDRPRAVSLRSWSAALAIALAAGLVLAIGPIRRAPEELRAKGPHGDARVPGLAIEALCAREDAAGLVPASHEGCSLEGTLSFAYRAAPGVRGQLTLFGLADDGTVHYYLPTPIDAALPHVAEGSWQPLPLAVKLSVNHDVGRVQVYALVSARPPDVDEVDAIAAALIGAQPHAREPSPWHLHLSSDPTLAALCGEDGSACHSARLAFELERNRP